MNRRESPVTRERRTGGPATGNLRFFGWCGQRPPGLNTAAKSGVATVPHGRSVHPDKRVAGWRTGDGDAPTVEGSIPAACPQPARPMAGRWARSEEHTSELQSLMRISYAVFCLKKKTE